MSLEMGLFPFLVLFPADPYVLESAQLPVQTLPVPALG